MTGPARAAEGQHGVVALEFALLVPLVGLLLLTVLLAGVHAVDHVVVQDAAAVAARTAATTTSDGPVHAAARDASGREVLVEVEPARRRPGDVVRVAVTFRRDVGWVTWTVRGEAVAAVEPGA